MRHIAQKQRLLIDRMWQDYECVESYRRMYPDEPVWREMEDMIRDTIATKTKEFCKNFHPVIGGRDRRTRWLRP